MEILWLAIILYSLGLGLVLHFRPALMFNENGTWKEFGYQRSPESRFTIFPFWLFAISWAFLSYALAATVSWIYPTIGTVAALESLDRFRSSNIPVDPHSFGPAPASYEEEEEEEEEEEGQYERPMGNGEVYDEETEVVEVAE